MRALVKKSYSSYYFPVQQKLDCFVKNVLKQLSLPTVDKCWFSGKPITSLIRGLYTSVIVSVSRKGFELKLFREQHLKISSFVYIQSLIHGAIFVEELNKKIGPSIL